MKAKSIFVIDMPEGYEKEDLLFDYCLHTKGEYKSIRKSGNNPLKPLPQKKNATKEWVKNTEDVAEAMKIGWNDYLEEIEE